MGQIRYYPIARVLPNQYTRGGEFITPEGKPYTGRYYVTYDNKVFAGVNPIIGSNIPLYPATSTTSNRVLKSSGMQTAVGAGGLPPQQQNTNAELTKVKQYNPVPLESDYAKGYFMRYFAKDPTGPRYVTEISPDDWGKIRDGQVAPTTLAYEILDMMWQLTGPLHDRRVSQYQITGGVYDTNKRITEAKAKGFVGLLSFIGENYTKFARITD